MIRSKKKAHSRGTRLILSALLSFCRRGSEDAQTTSFITSRTSRKRVPTSKRDPLRIGALNIERLELLKDDAMGFIPFIYIHLEQLLFHYIRNINRVKLSSIRRLVLCLSMIGLDVS